MKFQYLPNTFVVDYDKMKNVCVFDENGFFETDDDEIIKFLTTKRKHIKVVDEQPTQQQNVISDKEGLYTCKKCGFKTDNKGKFMAHCRTAHKKE